MTASVLPPAETTFLDANGAPLALGYVYTYVPATTTPKTTWQDAAKGVANANPTRLDAAGRCIMLGEGSYRTIVKDVNLVTIWDQVTSAADPNLTVTNLTVSGATNLDGGTVINSGLFLTGGLIGFGEFDIAGNIVQTSGSLTVSAGNLTLSAGSLVVNGSAFILNPGTATNEAVIFSQFPYISGTTGTETMPSGRIMKWGSGSTTNGVGSVTFAVAFPSACNNVQITISGASSTTTLSAVASGAITAAGFAVWGDATQSVGFEWLAIGH